MINVDFYKTFLLRILFHWKKTILLLFCQSVAMSFNAFFWYAECVNCVIVSLYVGPSLCLCMLVRHCVFVCIFLCLCLCLCFHSLMSVFVSVSVFISLYNLSTIGKRALFNLLIIVVKCITSIQWSNARQNVKDQNNSALLFNNIQLFFFTLNSLFIPILFQF